MTKFFSPSGATDTTHQNLHQNITSKLPRHAPLRRHGMAQAYHRPSWAACHRRQRISSTPGFIQPLRAALLLGHHKLFRRGRARPGDTQPVRETRVGLDYTDTGSRPQVDDPPNAVWCQDPTARWTSVALLIEPLAGQSGREASGWAQDLTSLFNQSSAGRGVLDFTCPGRWRLTPALVRWRVHGTDAFGAGSWKNPRPLASWSVSKLGALLGILMASVTLRRSHKGQLTGRLRRSPSPGPAFQPLHASQRGRSKVNCRHHAG